MLLKISKTAHRYYSKSLNKKPDWETVVGLEVHAQISSISKLFSGSATTFSSPVNSNVSLFDCSIPGTLPTLNKKCVEAGVLTALALNCKINPVSWFDRKHYFYADIPCGYQITQQRAPLANDGSVQFQVYSPSVHKTPYMANVRLKQLQLEQDSAKSLHDSDRSLIDLNRAGVPLMELVFEPDLSDGEEAAALIKELVNIFHRIQTCSCKMEEGALRVDANVSINKKGAAMGIRTEIKNIGSVRGVANAIEYEIQRQIKIKENGGEIINETRSWDAVNKATVGMRDKERQQDYRYMPEPNLPPLHVSVGIVEHGCVNVEELKMKLPELPNETRQRLLEFGLTKIQTSILVDDHYMLKIFEDSIKGKEVDVKMYVNLLMNEFKKLLNENDLKAENIVLMSNYKPDNFYQVINLLQRRKINRYTVDLLFKEILQNSSKTPLEFVTENNLFQITDDEALEKICKSVIDENENLVKQYKSGKQKVYKAIIAIAEKKSENRADMSKCTKIMKSLLDKI